MFNSITDYGFEFGRNLSFRFISGSKLVFLENIAFRSNSVILVDDVLEAVAYRNKNFSKPFFYSRGKYDQKDFAMYLTEAVFYMHDLFDVAGQDRLTARELANGGYIEMALTVERDVRMIIQALESSLQTTTKIPFNIPASVPLVPCKK